MNPEHSGVPLRRRVLTSILAVTALAVILFALPLGVAVQRLYRNAEGQGEQDHRERGDSQDRHQDAAAQRYPAGHGIHR